MSKSYCYYSNHLIVLLLAILVLGVQKSALGRDEKDSTESSDNRVKPDSMNLLSESTCVCFSRTMLDSILELGSVSMWWSDVPGCKLAPYHEMYEFVMRNTGLPDLDFNFSAQAGFIDGMPFVGSDLFNNRTGLYEFRCGGPTNLKESEPCTRLLRAFIADLRKVKPENDYCGQQGNIPSGFVISRPPPFWMSKQFIIPFTLFVFGIGFAFAIVIRKGQITRKNLILKEQALIIERQRDLETERNRIAAELHDELGSGLTSIRYWSGKGLRESTSPETVWRYQQISDRSLQVIESMREIIWAMNNRFDHVPYLTAYLHHFASKFTSEHELKLEFTEKEESSFDGTTISGVIRRNLFYVFKEILVNIVKHSGCTRVIIRIEVAEYYFIRITEMNGIGFDPETGMLKGNGIYNIRQRINAIKGRILYSSTSHGTDITISVPLK